MQKMADERGGECISTNYKNTKTKLKWKCAKGHIWKTVYEVIKNGSWCPICANRVPFSIRKMKDIAKSRGGECLSNNYVNNRTKLTWKCSEGHVWKSVYPVIKRGSWCPECRIFYSEALCKTTFEQLFSHKFLKTKPSWLLNSRGNKMELDGYCEKLQIAFEYQGAQHFKTGLYSDNKSVLKVRMQDDAKKVKLCKERGIKLFIIIFKDNLIELPALIRKQAHSLCLDVSSVNFNKEIDFNLVYLHQTYIEKMNMLASSRGGICLSKKYVNARTKLEWMCDMGHKWKTNPDEVRRGRWCPVCANRLTLTIDEMREIAKSRGGICLSKKYVNAKTKLKWKCELGHEWMARPDEVKNGGTWCPKCGGTQKFTIELMREIAKSKGGKCLSDTYVNSDTKLEWECSNGHTWWGIPNNVMRSAWCRTCYLELNKKIRMDEMHEIANSKGGKCLSDTYVNRVTKLEWECSMGHTWWAIPAKIIRSSWCTTCSKEQNNKQKMDEMRDIAKSRGGKCLSDTYDSANLLWECSKGHTWCATPANVKRKTWCPTCSREQKIKSK